MTTALATFRQTSWLTRQKISRALRGKRRRNRRRKERRRFARTVSRTGIAGLAVGSIAGRYRAKQKVSKVEQAFNRQMADLEKQIQNTRETLDKLGPPDKQARNNIGEAEKERQRQINRKIRQNRIRMDEIDVENETLIKKKKLTKKDYARLNENTSLKRDLQRQNNRYQRRKQRLGERVARLRRDARGATPEPTAKDQQRTATKAQLRQLQDQRRTTAADKKVSLDAADKAGRRGILKAAAIGAGVGLGAGALSYGVNRLRRQVKRNRRKRRRRLR